MVSKSKVTLHGTTYTRETAIADLVAVQSLFENRTVGQKLYREEGSVPDSVYVALFGTFQEFRRQAGLIPTRAQNTIRNAIARSAASDSLQRIRRERLDYGSTYAKDRGGRHRTLIACSDLHDKDCDPFLRRVLIDSIKRIQPEIIVSNGDHWDVPEFGKYFVDPREFDLVGRLQAGLDIFKDMREAAPDAQIDLIEGNHEARIIKHMSENSPPTMALLSDFHGMSMRELFRLDEFQINYVAAFDLAAYSDPQIRREVRKNSRVYWNSVLAHHFPDGRSRGIPGFNGHHHQHIVWSEYSQDRGSYEWHQLGAGHMRDATYCDGAKWANGFVIVNVDTESRDVHFDYCKVGTTMSIVGGQRYERTQAEMYPALIAENPTLKPFPGRAQR